MQTPITSNLVVITGGPGSGKTTLIDHLHQSGYDFSPDVARSVIDEQIERGGNALPWEDNEAYAGLFARRSIRAWQAGMECHPRPVFCDRALPDVLAHRRFTGLPDDQGLTGAIRTYRYHRTAFVLPPWSEIYKSGQDRTQSFADAVRTYVVLCRTYHECGYELVELRKGPVEHRAAQILSRLKL